jgi:uncharacterized protein (TIGR02996 family)
MADMMAIVSKAVFEKAAGKSPRVGTRLGMDRYVSTNKNLERLGEGGKLYLVTVRPPDEALWLVAILDHPRFDGAQWIARPCDIPITDITTLKNQLVFESGKGLPTKQGTLGMSLQTPRAVTGNDVRLLDSAAGLAAAPATELATGREGFPAAPEEVASTGAGSRRALLLQAVLADPDNEAARQVYADALVAANDPRGELILFDTALTGPLSIWKRERLARRKAELMKQHGKAWFPYKVQTRISRGFVVAAAGSLKKLEAAAPQLFAAEPVTEIQVSGVKGVTGARKLLAASWLPRIHKLIVRGEIASDGFEALVTSAQLANLRELNVVSNAIAGEALAALRGNLPRCRMLALSNNPIGSGVTGLVQWQHLNELETLYLGRCELTARAVAQLLDGPALDQLDRLALTDNELGNAAVGELVSRAGRLPALRSLELRRTGIGTAAVRQLLEAALPALRRIDVRGNGIDSRLAASDPRLVA